MRGKFLLAVTFGEHVCIWFWRNLRWSRDGNFIHFFKNYKIYQMSTPWAITIFNPHKNKLRILWLRIIWLKVQWIKIVYVSRGIMRDICRGLTCRFSMFTSLHSNLLPCVKMTVKFLKLLLLVLFFLLFAIQNHFHIISSNEYENMNGEKSSKEVIKEIL